MFEKWEKLENPFGPLSHKVIKVNEETAASGEAGQDAAGAGEGAGGVEAGAGEGTEGVEAGAGAEGVEAEAAGAGAGVVTSHTESVQRPGGS